MSTACNARVTSWHSPATTSGPYSLPLEIASASVNLGFFIVVPPISSHALGGPERPHGSLLKDLLDSAASDASIVTARGRLSVICEQSDCGKSALKARLAPV